MAQAGAESVNADECLGPDQHPVVTTHPQWVNI